MSSTCALCIIELVLKIIACNSVFIEVDITAWGGGGSNSLIPPVCFTCLCSSSFSSVGICSHLLHLATADQLYLFFFCFDFLLICANLKDFSRLVIAEVRICLVLVLTICPHLGASDQLVLLVHGLS